MSTTGKRSASIVSVEELAVRDRKVMLLTLDITCLQALHWTQEAASISVVRSGSTYEIRGELVHVKPLEGNAIPGVDASELHGGVAVGDRIGFGPA